MSVRISSSLIRFFCFSDHLFGNPKIHPSSFVFSDARIIGDVIISEEVIVAPGASIRADEQGPFFIGKGVNIQDGATIHAKEGGFVNVDGKDYAVHIGSHSSITHGAIIHGPCRIGKKVCVSFDSIVYNATVGNKCFIDMKAVVRNVTIPRDRYVAANQVVEDQETADNLPRITQEHLDFNCSVVDLNKKKLCKMYAERRRLKRNPLLRIYYYFSKKRITG